MSISFTSNYHILNENQKQTKKWAITSEYLAGSYSYQIIEDEFDNLEQLLEAINSAKTELNGKISYWNFGKNVECIRHISGLWFKVRRNPSGKYSVILQQS